MTLLEFHARLAKSNRPQLAMKMIMALVDHADEYQMNTWLSRSDIAAMTLADGGVLASHEKNVSKVGQQLLKLNLVKVRYRDHDGQWHDSSKKGVTTLYLVSPQVLVIFGRSWPIGR